MNELPEVTPSGPARVQGAAAALIFQMVERALQAQRDGGTAVEVVAPIDQSAAQAMGFAGEGEVRLAMRPCGIQPKDVISMRGRLG